MKPARGLAGIAAALAAVALLASCSSSGGIFKANPKAGLQTVPSDASYSPEMFLKQGYCPAIQIRPGTEALMVYEKGHEDDPAYVRFQGTIGQTARECKVLGPTTLAIKVGIAGRIAAGPKGGPGAVTATLRVAVIKQHGGKVFFTQAYKVPATIAAPTFAGDFSQVVDDIQVTLTGDDRDLVVYVGFDEGVPKPPTG